MLQHLTAAVALFLVAGPAAAVVVHLNGPAECFSSGALVMRADETRDPIRVVLQSGKTDYELSPGDAASTVRAEGNDCWSETRTIAATDRNATIALFRTATVQSAFTGGKPSPLIRASVMRGNTADPADCTTDGSRWSCAVPADVSFHLRIEPSGYAAVFYWDLHLTGAAPHRLTPAALLPGASVAGWVQDSRGRPLSDAKIVVRPRAIGASQPSGTAATATTSDHRGFFQVTGLTAADYALVASSGGRSPASVVVRLRDGESLLWPRPIALAPLARLEVQLDPPMHEATPWNVELTERSPVDGSAVPLQHAAGPDGKWIADRLRATEYSLTVKNAAGSSLERRDVDLSAGGATFLPIIVRAIAVRGTVTTGDEPLRADIVLSDGKGNYARTTAAEDGTFTVDVPAPGKWQVSVRYPSGSSSRIQAEPVEIAAEGSNIEIRLPGGRLRGTVATKEGTHPEAVVRIFRNDRSVGSQRTSAEEGTFDIIGLKEGDYTVDAVAQNAMTPAPVPLHLEKDGKRELDLVLEQPRSIRGSVVTTAGTPAIGTVLHLSLDGLTWFSTATDARGAFERHVPANTAEVWIVPVSYSYPSTIVHVALPNDGVTIVLQPAGGEVHVRARGGTVIRNAVAAAPAAAFYLGDGFGPPVERIYLEPGAYAVCTVGGASCRGINVNAGSELTVDLDSP